MTTSETNPSSTSLPSAPQAPQSSSPSMPNSDKIHWATPPSPVSSQELEAQFEQARARNWISDRLIAQSQRHWHCTRDQAIQRLLTQQG